MRCNADKLFARFLVDNVLALSCYDTCNVRAVRGVGGEYVGVVVCVVVSERNLFAVVHFVYGSVGFEVVSRSHLGGNSFLCPQLGFVRRCGLESFVRVVKTRIQDSHYHACALFVKVGGIVDTRRVHVGVVFDGNLGLAVRFGKGNALNFRHVLDFVVSVGVNLDCHAVVEHRVGVLERVVDTRLVQLGQELFVLLFDFRLDVLALFACGKVAEGHRGVLLFVLGVHGFVAQFHYYPSVAVVGSLGVGVRRNARVVVCFADCTYVHVVNLGKRAAHKLRECRGACLHAQRRQHKGHTQGQRKHHVENTDKFCSSFIHTSLATIVNQPPKNRKVRYRFGKVFRLLFGCRISNIIIYSTTSGVFYQLI